MIVRPATIDDAPALCGYAARLFSEDLPGIFRRSVPTLDEEVAFIQQRIGPANSTLLVALEDGVPVGLADLLGSTLEEERHAGTFGISVDRDWRGRGVGTALIEALVEWAAANGITRIQAFAWETNPRALELYERLGFVREGVCRRAVVRDGVPVDVVMIARLLDEETEK
ncbi:MAG TPA: GNAT family N-acetyltransferase [Coriobacteriia bacterium]|nr:GNAT family N-acetyltransferase [Coriobacteriia bacterium]